MQMAHETIQLLVCVVGYFYHLKFYSIVIVLSGLPFFSCDFWCITKNSNIYFCTKKRSQVWMEYFCRP